VSLRRYLCSTSCTKVSATEININSPKWLFQIINAISRLRLNTEPGCKHGKIHPQVRLQYTCRSETIGIGRPLVIAAAMMSWPPSWNCDVITEIRLLKSKKKSATVAEFRRCLTVFGDSRTFLRQCGQDFSRRVFAWGTILPNFTPIWFKTTTEP